MSTQFGNAGNNHLIGDIDADIDDDLYGESGDDWLEGRTGNDNLFGGDGNDILDGGTGTDAMVGGLGNDTYYVNTAADSITEGNAVGSGIDKVFSRAADYTLSANIENMKLQDASFVIGPGGVLQLLPAGVNGTGNALGNVIEGNAVANTLSGLGGNDFLYGYAGHDTLNGGTGNDYLNGGTGNDAMAGSIGNDTYIVDSTADAISEGAFLGGTDIALASANYTLSANVENLTLTGVGNINGTGNTGVNVINGNAEANTLDGGAGADTMAGGSGNDTYIVDNGSDSVSEGAGGGTDWVLASVTETLTDPDVEHLRLTGVGATNGTGNASANTIQGNTAANTLSGLGGNDSLSSGAGNDTVLGGSGNDVISASSGNDLVQGGTGADRIGGSTGIDTLRAVDNVAFANDNAIDTFVFNTTPNTATNFDLIDKATFVGGGEANDDEIELENAVFTALQNGGGGNIGTLSAGMYFEGGALGLGHGMAASAAVGVYNDTTTGQLYYNPTFGTANDSVLFAVVNVAGVAGGSASLSADEFTLA